MFRRRENRILFLELKVGEIQSLSITGAINNIREFDLFTALQKISADQERFTTSSRIEN